MKHKFDIQRDGGVDPVDWSKIDLPRSGPTRYPSEPQPDREETCFEAARNGDPKPLKDYLDELKAQMPMALTSMPSLASGMLPEEFVTKPCNPPEVEEAVKLLQEPVGPTAKFNPTTKAWEMPENPG